MGTETKKASDVFAIYDSRVKLNNPLMGTEIISMWEYLFSHSMWMVKKYPPDGDGKFLCQFITSLSLVVKLN